VCLTTQLSTAYALYPCSACKQHPVAAAGTPEEASARRWLQVQGGAVKCVRGLTVEEDAEHVPGLDLAGQLSTLLASLPALTSIDGLVLQTDTRIGTTAAAHQAFLAGAARAIARCSSLQQLNVHIQLYNRDQLPLALVRELASVRTLEEVTLRFGDEFADEADRPDWPGTFSLTHLVAGLAGLPRLRALSLAVENVGMGATLPVSVSRLARLTSLSLSGFHGLRCARGWARLPALAELWFDECVFACDGENALPGMDGLVALTRFNVWNCPSLRVLPASLWGLTQLRHLAHWGEYSGLGLMTHDALPVAFAPAGGAPCFASLTHLKLAWSRLQAFPTGALAATRLMHLDLRDCCFEQLPVGVSVLTGLEELCLGRHAAGEMEIGGCLDAQALGSLAGFPSLRRLQFLTSSVLLCSSFQAAAVHPRLERLQLSASYPAPGPSFLAVMGFVTSLLQRGCPGVLELCRSVVKGAGRRNSRNFRGALQAAEYPLSDADSRDLV
jgi:hypothetical protein